MELNDLQKQVIAALQNKRQTYEDGMKMIMRAQPDGNYTKEQKEAIEQYKKNIELINTQIEKASEPVNRTPEEQAKLDRFLDNMTVEVDNTAVEGASANKELTPKQKLEASLKNYVKQVEESIEPLKMSIAIQEQVVVLLDPAKLGAVSEEFKTEYDALYAQYEAILEEMKQTLANAEKRLEMAKAGMVDNMLNMFEDIAKINFFLNDPLKLGI